MNIDADTQTEDTSVAVHEPLVRDQIVIELKDTLGVFMTNANNSEVETALSDQPTDGKTIGEWVMKPCNKGFGLRTTATTGVEALDD